MDLNKSPKALLRDLSKVLLDSSRALEEAQKRDAEDTLDDESGEKNLIVHFCKIVMFISACKSLKLCGEKRASSLLTKGVNSV